MKKGIVVQANIDSEKVGRDLDFLSSIIDLSQKLDWRVVVSGGYGLDILLGKTTRTHDDLDVIIYGAGERENIKKGK